MARNTSSTHDRDADHRAGSAGGADPHRSRVIAAEVRRLQRHLLAIGPMPRHKLAEGCATERWREGTLEEAIHEGVRLGKLRELPLGWVEATTGTPDSQAH